MNPEDRLRQAFEARADRVEFAPDALGSIRARVSRGTHRRRVLTMSLASLATGAAATVTAVVVGLTSCVPPATPPVPPGSPTDPGPTVTTPPPGVSARLPVYFVGSDGSRVVLYREWHNQTVPEDSLPERIRAAVAVMLGGEPFDQDYGSDWPSGATVRGVELQGSVAVVDLAGAASNSLGAERSEAAVQQLVYTVTGVTADRNVQLTGVRLLLDGQPAAELWGHVGIGGILTRAPMLNTLARLWLISPQEGDTVKGTFEVHVDGSVPEATAILRVRNAAGTLVQEKVLTLNAGGPARGQIKTTITLAPGRYTLEVFFHSLADGSVQSLDDHAVTVG